MYARTLSIASGDTGVRQTVAHMRDLIARAIVNPGFRQYVATLAGQYGSNNRTVLARSLRDWIDDHTQFMRDPDGVELLHDPVLLLTRAANGHMLYVDCDDVAALAGAMAKAIGLRTRFVVVGFRRPNAPFTHIWVEVQGNGGTWIDMDVTRTAQSLDIPVTRRMVIPV